MKSYLLLFVCGCSLVTPLGELTSGADGSIADAGTEGGMDVSMPDAPLDAAPSCNPTAPFGMPTEIAALNMPSLGSATPRMTRDQKTVYFQAGWPGGAGANDLYYATRTSTAAPFGPATRITGLASMNDDWDPSPTADDLALYFGTLRVQPENIWIAIRANVTDSYATPSIAPDINVASFATAEPWVLPNRVMYMVSTRTGTLGGFDVYRADWNGSSHAAPVHVDNVSSMSDEHLPIVTPDEKTMFVSSSRPGGKGAHDIYIARKSGTSFDVPSNVTELNSGFSDFVSWVSDDGCVVLMFSNRADAMHQHIYEARRP